MAVDKNIVVENARIGIRNFSGKATQFAPAGKRSFHWFMDRDLAEQLEQDGWNVRWMTPKNGDDTIPHLEVTVRYNDYPPKVVLVTNRGKTILDEETVGTLDWAEIQNVDMIIRPYNYDFAGRSGTKAFLKTMYVTIVEDELEAKYAEPYVGNDDVPFD